MAMQWLKLKTGQKANRSDHKKDQALKKIRPKNRSGHKKDQAIE
jgi:hypothetical protein